MKEKAKDLEHVFKGISDEAKEHINLLDKLIEKFAMVPEEVNAMIENNISADQRYPELANIEGMTSAEFAELYKKMAKEVMDSPETFEHHMRITGLSEEEMANIFGQIGDSIERYPEIWKSQEDAHMQGPKNLAILMHAFRKQD